MLPVKMVFYQTLLRVQIWSFARVLPLLIRRRAFMDCLNCVRVPKLQRTVEATTLPAERICKLVKRSLRSPLVMKDRRCFREGLVASKFLLKAGYRPVLIFGTFRMNEGSGRIEAHCWVELNGKMILNGPVDEMTVLYRHHWKN